MEVIAADNFDNWRNAARGLLAANVAPEDIRWTEPTSQLSLFNAVEATDRPVVAPVVNVPKEFLELARYVACHRDIGRWHFLYRTLWRIVHGEAHLLKIATDDDVHLLNRMQKSVTRDVHKMKAFVRFRKVVSVSGEENFIAWHRPDYRIIRLTAPFFARRFKGMNWTILTPDESATWDQQELRYGPGAPLNDAPSGDALEELWKTYYASIFNPARVKVAMMKREMPVRHWPTLPEASIINELLQQAPQRVDAMIQRTEGFAETAMNYMPELDDLESLRHAAACCKACHLYEHATQMVFGEGLPNASIVIVGEQPGDKEDIVGRPFVGPAGKLLDDALASAGIQRGDVYITNVVKHFKFTETSNSRGKQRLHKKPDSREIFACRPWLEAELAAIKPAAILCLGATSSQALFGLDFRITKDRGKVLPTEWCPRTIATWHPAAILRMPVPGKRQQMLDQFVEDLHAAKKKRDELV